MKEFLSEAAFKGMKIAQYEAIPVVKDMECPNCHKSDVNGFPPCIYARPIGWCDTPTGLMGIFECPKCFCKFRCHINTTGRYHEDRFYDDFSLMYYLYDERKGTMR